MGNSPFSVPEIITLGNVSGEEIAELKSTFKAQFLTFLKRYLGSTQLLMPQLNADNINQIPDPNTGVYRIYARTANNNNIIPTQRFSGVDNYGLLYIGRTSRQTLRKRLYQFYASSSLNLNTYNHSGALKYKDLEIIRTTLGLGHVLHFEYEICDNPELRENALLTEYSNQFGEYPPLNK